MKKLLILLLAALLGFHAFGQVTTTTKSLGNGGAVAKTIGAYKGYFSPTNLPNLTLWLSSFSFTIANGTKPSSWPDLSGNGNNATQSTNADQPTFSATNINNHPSLHFGGNPVLMWTPSFLTSAYNSNFTMFIVCQNAASDNNARFFLGTTGAAVAFGMSPGSFYLTLNGGNGTVGIPSPHTRPYVHTMRVDAVSSTYRENGMQISSNAFTGPLGMNGPLALGNTDNNNGAMLGDIGELIIYKGALADADCALVERYLMDKFTIGKANVIFDGDSITYGTGSSAQNSYPCLAMLQIGATFDAENFGHPGYTAAQILTNSPQYLDPRWGSGRDTVSVLIGVNDLLNGATTASVETNISGYCRARQLAGYRVVVGTILPSANAGPPAGFETSRQAVNTWLRLNWRLFANALADIASDPVMGLTNNCINATYYNSDFLHPTSVGYALIAPYFATAIAQAPSDFQLTNAVPGSVTFSGGTITSAPKLWITITNGVTPFSIPVY